MDAIVSQAAISNLMHSLAPIRHLMEDPTVQEIMINKADDVWVERAGVKSRTDIKISDISISGAITVLGRLNRKDVTPGTPDGIVDAKLPGLRIAACLPPISVFGPSMCIRKHSETLFTLDDYVTAGSLTAEWAENIRTMVRTHRNILVVGGTSSGKTTFVNALINEIDPGERVFTIEDTPELKVRVPNWTPFEVNNQQGVTARLLLKLALRYAPSRILVGEVRGGEAYDLLDAANTGHDGCIATLHANSAFDALSRMETLVLQGGVDWPHHAICAQISRTFHNVIFMAKRNGVRQLCQVLAMKGFDRTTGQYDTEMLLQL